MRFSHIAVCALIATRFGGCGGGGGGGETGPLFERHAANPLYTSSGSAWNFAGIGDPSVMYDEDDALWKMWTSAGGVAPPDMDVEVRTQYLTSPDGLVWTELAANPVFAGGPGAADWDRGGVETPCVLKDGGQYWLWYAGYEIRQQPPIGMSIGAATSSNGIDWVRSGSSAVLSPGAPGTWDEAFVESPAVVKLGGTYFMWYSGVSTADFFGIGLATSPDGVTWTKHPSNPVLAPNASHAWENGAVYGASVVHDGSRFRMLYVGLNDVTFLGAMRIGMATSTDGVTWKRSTSNPVLDLGAPGDWDESGAFVPSVVQRDGAYWMYYLSGANPDETLGLATWTPSRARFAAALPIRSAAEPLWRALARGE